MATLVKTPSSKWKAIIRKAGWPLTVKTFRTQRDTGDWARRTEDDMVRGAFIQRAAGDRITVAAAVKCYLADVVPSEQSEHLRCQWQPSDGCALLHVLQHFRAVLQFICTQRHREKWLFV
jgi:hypothetical protein